MHEDAEVRQKTVHYLLCEFLDVLSLKTPNDCVVAADSFIMAMNKPSTTFTKSPLKCLKILISQIRKDGQEVSKLMSARS
jgi:hypothetical protein